MSITIESVDAITTAQMSQWAVDEYWKHMGPEALEAAIAEKNGRRDALEAELIAAQSKGLGRRLVGAVRWLRRAPPSDEGDDVAALKEAIVRLEDEIGALQAIDEQLRLQEERAAPAARDLQLLWQPRRPRRC